MCPLKWVQGPEVSMGTAEEALLQQMCERRESEAKAPGPPPSYCVPTASGLPVAQSSAARHSSEDENHNPRRLGSWMLYF